MKLWDAGQMNVGKGKGGSVPSGNMPPSPLMPTIPFPPPQGSEVKGKGKGKGGKGAGKQSQTQSWDPRAPPAAGLFIELVSVAVW